MKQWICIAWIILVGLQMGYQGIVYAYYTLQKEQITAQFCENKDKPALKCEGKCHLKTLLAANEDPEKCPQESSAPPKEIYLQPWIGLLQPLPSFSSYTTFSITLWRPTKWRTAREQYDYLAAFEWLDPPQLKDSCYS